MISLNKLELEAISNITGYTFNTPILFEEIDNVAIIRGLRYFVKSIDIIIIHTL